MKPKILFKIKIIFDFIRLLDLNLFVLKKGLPGLQGPRGPTGPIGVKGEHGLPGEK